MTNSQRSCHREGKLSRESMQVSRLCYCEYRNPFQSSLLLSKIPSQLNPSWEEETCGVASRKESQTVWAPGDSQEGRPRGLHRKGMGCPGWRHVHTWELASEICHLKWKLTLQVCLLLELESLNMCLMLNLSLAHEVLTNNW